MEGFTLLEVMLALIIFALTALTLVNSLGVSVNGTIRVQQQQLALWVADNQMIEETLSSTTGNSEGTTEMGGVSWHWKSVHGSTDDLQTQRLSVSYEGQPITTLQRYDFPGRLLKHEKQ